MSTCIEEGKTYIVNQEAIINPSSKFPRKVKDSLAFPFKHAKIHIIKIHGTRYNDWVDVEVSDEDIDNPEDRFNYGWLNRWCIEDNNKHIL